MLIAGSSPQSLYFMTMPHDMLCVGSYKRMSLVGENLPLALGQQQYLDYCVFY